MRLKKFNLNTDRVVSPPQKINGVGSNKRLSAWEEKPSIDLQELVKNISNNNIFKNVEEKSKERESKIILSKLVDRFY